MESLVSAFISLALLRNLLLTQAIGLGAALATGGRLDTACAHAASTLLALVAAAPVAFAADRWLLQPADATALRLLLWSALCLASSALAQRLVSDRHPVLGERIVAQGLIGAGYLLQLVVLSMVTVNSDSVAHATFNALALGAGYGAATITLAGWHGRLLSAGLPNAVSLSAALLLSTAIASMAVLGLGGA
ncbi:MAG: Rnf-Nqr domain containing protein [Pseudomonadota bacterium]